jgi:hypothetical protein
LPVHVAVDLEVGDPDVLDAIAGVHVGLVASDEDHRLQDVVGEPQDRTCLPDQIHVRAGDV